jgi:hypothetical protein
MLLLDRYGEGENFLLGEFVERPDHPQPLLEWF